MLGVLRASFAPPLLALRVPTALTLSMGHARSFMTTPIISAAAAATKAKATKKPAASKTAVKKPAAKKITAKKATTKTVAKKKASDKPKKKDEKKPKRPKLDIPKDQLPPKRPNLPYALFTASRSIVDPFKSKGNVGEWSKRQAEVWRGMSDVEKAPFYKRYEEAQAEYTKAIQEWINKTPESIVSRYRRFYRKKGKTPSVSRAALAGREGRVTTRGGAYVLFFKEQNKEHGNDFPAGTHMTVKMKAFAEKWRAMSESEKEVYRQRHAAAKEELEKKKAELAAGA